MKRSQFLASLLGVIAAPFMAKALAEDNTGTGLIHQIKNNPYRLAIKSPHDNGIFILQPTGVTMMGECNYDFVFEKPSVELLKSSFGGVTIVDKNDNAYYSPSSWLDKKNMIRHVSFRAINTNQSLLDFKKGDSFDIFI